jgi:hypothetical protein
MRELASHIGVTRDLARSESQNALVMSASGHGWNFGEGYPSKQPTNYWLPSKVFLMAVSASRRFETERPTAAFRETI